MNRGINIRTIEELREFLKDFFKGKNVQIFLFGSRARKDNSKFSDLDIGFISSDNISKEIVILKEIIEESNIPYKVDIVNLGNNKQLLDVALKEGEKWL